MQISNGIDIIRAYELSWLNGNGKPQLSLLEITQPMSTRCFDTLALKKFLESIHNNKYKDRSDVNSVIKDYLNCDFTITHQEDFSGIIFFEDLDLLDLVKTSQGLRFICPATSQPYIGTLNLVFKKSEVDNTELKSIHELVSKDILNVVRNSDFTPKTFVAHLFIELKEKLNHDFLMSVHLHRRGGISYQAIRCTEERDLTPFLSRAIME